MEIKPQYVGIFCVVNSTAVTCQFRHKPVNKEIQPVSRLSQWTVCLTLPTVNVVNIRPSFHHYVPQIHWQHTVFWLIDRQTDQLMDEARADLNDGSWSHFTHVLYGVLITEPVGTFHSVVEMPLPLVILCITQSCIHSTLTTAHPTSHGYILPTSTLHYLLHVTSVAVYYKQAEETNHFHVHRHKHSTHLTPYGTINTQQQKSIY